MRIHILGSGTSTGVPEVGCTCEVCTSADPKDNRLRASSLIEINNKTLLIDCGPDFREQILRLGFRPITAVLMTHEHYDHVGGLDDLRPFSAKGELPIYGNAHTMENLRIRMPYCFAEKKYPGIPNISLHIVDSAQSFFIDDLEIIPIQIMHGRFPILGYRIGKMAYITDMLTMADEEYEKLQGLDCLIMNALRIKPHMTHQNLEQALTNAKRIGARDSYFIHMSHHMGLHKEMEKHLPEHIHFAYDGLEIAL